MCEERLRLLDIYDKTVKWYAQVTADLKLATTIPMDEFQLVKRSCDEARAQVLNAKAALRQHRQEHGCYALTFDVYA